jgi:hypothetical protein
MKLWARLCGYHVDCDDGTSAEIIAAYAWYNAAADWKFADFDDDAERKRLEVYFSTAIVDMLPPNAAYHLQDCFRVRTAPKVAGGQTTGPCLLNLSHKGKCKSELEEDVAGAAIEHLLAPLDDSKEVFADSTAKDRVKDSDAISVADALAEVQKELNRVTQSRLKETYDNLRSHYMKHMGADSHIFYKEDTWDSEGGRKGGREGGPHGNADYRKARAVLATFLPPPTKEDVDPQSPPGRKESKDRQPPPDDNGDGGDEGSRNAVSKSRKRPEGSTKRVGTPLGLGLTIAARDAVRQVRMVGDLPLQVQFAHCRYLLSYPRWDRARS